MNVRARIRVLIIGGYGAFGSRLVELLKDEPRLKLIIAGRSRSRAKTICIMESRAELVPAEFDRDGDVEAQIGWLEPDIVVVRQAVQQQEDEVQDRRVIREEDLKNHMDTEDAAPSDQTAESAEEAKVKEQLEKDNQLARALDVLKSWEIFSQIKYANE